MTSVPSGSAGTGPTANALSTAYRIEGHNLRLVRLPEAKIALQFELLNGTGEALDTFWAYGAYEDRKSVV